MARRAEEEENHWPGFVDALSTIVMVVTFLLIILGIVIFVISLQVKISDDLGAQGTINASMVVAEGEIRERQIRIELAEIAEVAAQQAKIIEQQTKHIEEAIAAKKTVEALQKELEERKQQLAQLADRAVSMEKTGGAEIQAKTPDETVEIVVSPPQHQDTTSQTRRTSVQSADAIMIVRFEDGAIELNEDSHVEAKQFLDRNQSVVARQPITLLSYYNVSAIAVSQSKRQAYYRVLAVRNALLSNSIDGALIEVGVRPADDEKDFDTVKAFLR